METKEKQGTYKKIEAKLSNAQNEYLVGYHNWMRSSDSQETRQKQVAVPAKA